MSLFVQAATYDVTKFGAKGDGKTLNTKAIQAAIDKAEKDGGGTIVIPNGVFMCGSIFLKDNTTLQIESGATLLGSPNIKDYKELTWGGDGNKDRQPYHFINADGVKNVTICGFGTIDGNGKAFWEPIPEKMPRWIKAKQSRTSPMIELHNVTDLRIRDVYITNPSGWTLHLFDCERVNVDGIKIMNNLFSPNSDGIDITGGNDISITGCHISTCDDAICLKTSPDSRECRRVSVTNCIIRTMCVALKIGNESYKDFSHVTFSNCVVYESSRPIGIYTQDGGRIDDVTITNITSDTKAPFIFGRPIHISLLQPQGKPKTGAIRNVLISNFTSQTDGRILMTAEDGSMLENITLRDIHLTYPGIEDPVMYVEGAKSRQFSPKSPEAKRARAAVVADNIKNLAIDNLVITWPTEKQLPKDWQFPERIEHGGDRVFTPDYSKARNTEFSILWGKNLEGGYLRIPQAKASAENVQPLIFTGKCYIKQLD